MKYVLIGSESAVLGFSMVGVDCRNADSESAARQALEDAFSQEDVGIIIITESVADMIRDEVNRSMFTRSFPLIVEIPDEHTISRSRTSMRDLAHQAIGISL